jgi:hypothetical protein
MSLMESIPRLGYKVMIFASESVDVAFVWMSRTRYSEINGYTQVHFPGW